MTAAEALEVNGKQDGHQKGRQEGVQKILFALLQPHFVIAIGSHYLDEVENVF